MVNCVYTFVIITDCQQGHFSLSLVFTLLGLKTDLYAAISLYTFLGLGYDGLACLATSMMDLEIAAHFDKPFFSKSFSNMWGRRWNMSIGNTLRALIYDPIQEGESAGRCHAWVVQGSCWGHAGVMQVSCRGRAGVMQGCNRPCAQC